MKVAFQMQAMEETDTGVSNSLVFIQEARARGYEVYHYLQESLTIDNETIRAFAAPVQVDMSQDQYYDLGEYRSLDLTTIDVVFLRQLPPVDMNYITSTYILDRLQDKGVFVTNNPSGIRSTPEKLSIFEFSEHIPPTIISRHIPEIKAFLEKHGDVVVKDLHGFGGKHVRRMSSMEEIEDHIEKLGEPVMIQPFIEEAYEGTTRVVMFDGEIVGALRAMPNPGEFLVYQGGQEIAHTPTDSEIIICDKISKILKSRNIHFAGIDFLGSHLLEINVTCVGSLMRLNKIYGGKYEAKLWDVLERKIAAFQDSGS